MRDISTLRPVQHIYHGRGVVDVRTPACALPDPAGIKIPTIADSVPVTWIMSYPVVCARADLHSDAVSELMFRHKIGCLPVVDGDGIPIGMITTRDVLEQVLAATAPETTAPALVAGQLMMPLALTLEEHATVAHVVATMVVEAIHHVPIVSGAGCLIGVVSSMDIVRWLASYFSLHERTSP